MQKFFLFCIVAFFLTGCEPASPENILSTIPVQVGDQTFVAEVADTPALRSAGLMHRADLAPDAGMLFVFDTPDTYSFWMKNTLIPLDVIWISSEKEVVEAQTLEPCPLTARECPSFAPSAPAQWVLEVGAGQFSGQIGDRVEFDFD